MKGALPLLALLDALVLYAGCTGMAGPLAGVAHAGLSLAALLVALRRPGQRHAILVTIAASLGAVAILAVPLVRRPFGPIAAPPRPRRRQGVKRVAAAHVPSFGRRLTDKLESRQINTAPAAQLQSLHRYLRHGSHAQRQGVVSATVRSFDVSLTPVVLRAMGDEDQAVRAQAAAAATEITRKLVNGRLALEEAGDNAGLARLLANHAQRNVLLSEVMRTQFRDTAVTLLREEEEPDAEARLLLASVLFDQGRASAAAAELLPLTEPGQAITDEALALLMEALLAARDFAALERLGARYADRLPAGSLFVPAGVPA